MNGTLSYSSVPHIRPPSRISHPLHFQPKFLHRYFYPAYRPPNHGHSTKMIFVETPALSSSRSPWQCKNEASIHRTATEFAVRIASVFAPEWHQSATLTAHWKDKAAVYAVANLCQSILTIKFLGLGGPGQQNIARADRQLLSVCIL